jgi:hypothetical protein
VRKDILPYYRALGLSPGAEAIEIRRAYRQMMQQWHPDLYKAGSPMQTTAEDITKEINEAYEQLYRKKLYRNFLPKSERKEESRAAAPTPDVPEPSPAPAPPKRRNPRSRKARKWLWLDWSKWNSVRTTILASRWTRPAALVAGAGLALFLGRLWLETADFGGNADSPRGPARTVASGIANEELDGEGRASASPSPFPKAVSEVETPPARFATLTLLEFKAAAEADHALVMDRAGTLLDAIELGDSRARVRAIQGEPDEISDTLYRYGSSVVYFRYGRVSAWRNRVPRLRVRDWSASVLPTLDRFELGSSRADVVRAQGLPATFDATSYTYGSSVVSFERGQVSGWSEGDVRLQHFEMPSLPFLDLDRMSLWDTGPF